MNEQGIVVTFAKDSAGEWRWVAADAGNHLKLAESSEGYLHRVDAESAARQVVRDGATYNFPA